MQLIRSFFRNYIGSCLERIDENTPSIRNGHFGPSNAYMYDSGFIFVEEFEFNSALSLERAVCKSGFLSKPAEKTLQRENP